MTARVLDTWTRPDGRSRARLFQRPDGFYRYTLEALIYEERPIVAEQGFGDWRTTHRSGLIAGFAAAQTAVLSQLSWFATDQEAAG